MWRAVYMSKLNINSSPFNDPLLSTFHMHECQGWLWHDPYLQSSEPREAGGCEHRKLEYNKCSKRQKRSLHKGLLRNREESNTFIQESGKCPQKRSRVKLSKYEKGKASLIHFAISTRLRKVLWHKDAQEIAITLLNGWIKRLIFLTTPFFSTPSSQQHLPTCSLQPQGEPPFHYSSLSLPGLL